MEAILAPENLGPLFLVGSFGVIAGVPCTVAVAAPLYCVRE